MKLVVYVNDEFEDEKALFDLDTKEVLVKGDQYHDSISGRIAGYIEALDDFDIYSEEIKREYIDSDHEHYKLIGFYSEKE
jgi:hypothetical protein